MIRARLRRLLRDDRGNIAMMFAASLFPLAFLTGMGIDYTMASDRQGQLNGFADAAALAAVTPAMMAQSDATATNTAIHTFNEQAAQVTSVSYSPRNLTVSVSTDNTGKRTATVTYTAASPTVFSTLLGRKQMNIGGSSTVTRDPPQMITFDLLPNDSESTAIATRFWHSR